MPQRRPLRTMKWLIPGLWLASILFAHFRGRVRLSLSRQMLDHSVLLAPVNHLHGADLARAHHPVPDHQRNPRAEGAGRQLETIRDEALKMAELRRIKAAERHDDIGFNSFFKYGWKRFYLKWYDARHPPPRALPQDRGHPQEPAQGQGGHVRRAAAGRQAEPAPRPFLGIAALPPGPGHAQRRSLLHRRRRRLQLARWRKRGVRRNLCARSAQQRAKGNRIILFCDVERPLKWRWAEAFNRWFGRVVMSAASSLNDAGDQTGAINKLTHAHWVIDQKRKQFKAWNRTVYKATKWGLIALVAIGFLALLTTRVPVPAETGTR